MYLIKRIALLSLALVFFQPTAFAQWTINNMMQVKLIKNVEASPDGQKVAYTVVRYIKVHNVWQEDKQIFLTDRNASKTYQLTHEKGKSKLPKWSPDGKYIAFVTKIGKSSTLKIIRADGGQAWTLVQSKTPITKLAWSANSKSIAFIEDNFATKLTPPKPITFTFINIPNNNLWIAHLNKKKRLIKKPEKVTHYTRKSDTGSIGSIDWSPDGSKLAFIRFSPKTDAYWSNGSLMVLDIKNKKIHKLIKRKMLQHCPHFSPDGKTIAFLSGLHVYLVPAAGGQPKQLAKTPDQLPLALIGWSADGKHIYVQEYYHTYYSILDLSADGKTVNIINPKNKLIKYISLNANHNEFAFNMQDSSHAEEAYISKLNPFKPVRISNVNIDAPKYPLGITKVIHWQSKDGSTIEGLLTYPVGYKEGSGKRYPLLVENHGGPGFVFQQYYTARRSVYPISVLSTQGYLYFRPNIRGSAGYSLKFRASIHKDWGGADYQDMISGVQHLIDLGIADPDRVGIFGWSFGGYMGLWAITQTHQFKAASVGGAISDLISYAGTTDLPNFIPNAFGGYFWDNSTLYLARSPIMHVKNVKTPTLLLNGQLDYRVPHTQSEEFYRALKQQGIPTELILYPNTYHTIKIPYWIFDAAKRNVAWMNKYVKNSHHTGFSLTSRH